MPMPAQHPCNSMPRERGFTLIEMIVAMTIALILAGIAIILFQGGKASAYHGEGISAGSAYLQSIAGYASDHANRTPDAGSFDPKTGPLNLIDKPYLGSQPDGVANGRINVTNDGQGCSDSIGDGTGGSFISVVSMCFDGSGGYFVRVASRRNAGAAWDLEDGSQLCFLGGTALKPRC